jgi:2'-5' RNA ligase
VRDEGEGAVVFAASDKAVAAAFMVRWGDDWVRLGRFGDEPWHIIISDRERFSRMDQGGAIYTLPPDSFTTDRARGMGEDEWVSHAPVIPLSSEACPSALEAMRASGMKVYFVTPAEFRAIESSGDDGEAMLRRLTGIGKTAAYTRVTARVRTVKSEDGEPEEGIMVAIVPPGSVLDHLQEVMRPLDHEPEPRKKMHVTVLYLGKTSEHTQAELDKLPELVKQWAKTVAPFPASIQGGGTFRNEGNHPVLALVDVPGDARKLNASLAEFIGGHGISVHEDHAWVPHVTLAYSEEPVRFLPDIRKMPWRVKECWYVCAGRWESVPFAGRQA